MSFVALRVKNVGSVTFEGRWEAQLFRIPPGETCLCPEAGVWAWTGKPDVIDRPSRPDRTQEYRRLRGVYGAFDDNDLWEQNRPQLEVYDASGARVWTIVEDPTGEHVSPVDTTGADKESYRRMISDLQEQIDGLKRQSLIFDHDNPPNLMEDAPEDTPMGAPRRGRAAG